MQLINADSTEVKEKWDELVSSYNASVFSESTYLDATAGNWMILYSDDFKSGMACPYVLKGGVKVLVTPFFNRFMEWIGEPVGENELIRTLKNEFPVADLQVGKGFNLGQRVFQKLAPGNLKLNQQAKRSLNKAAELQVEQGEHISAMMDLLRNELQNRIPGINEETLPILEHLVNKYRYKGLGQFNLYNENEWLGGIWIIETSTTVLYLKGTTREEAKKSGGMYKLMHHAVTYAHSKGKVFDFGGSNVESVRRFNLNFGAEDVVYSHLSWNNAPFWWKTVKMIRDKWVKK
ncbi:GNAT family N-acetyltransferase [Fluviicola chungangensis]|uniref:GNAT family N-acetyltransferase n=1 Tax=Fluviicola chungangensis TaxID=2597671 RepID=A0A556MRF6_9FLAO|nr:GNAT family N-acetyltransferase [Fluviicola chungangensis]TSJ42369.1 GNAT family N-acetyltransferase [Fluviicola chungangensis]